MRQGAFWWDELEDILLPVPRSSSSGSSSRCLRRPSPGPWKMPPEPLPRLSRWRAWQHRSIPAEAVRPFMSLSGSSCTSFRMRPVKSPRGSSTEWAGGAAPRSSHRPLTVQEVCGARRRRPDRVGAHTVNHPASAGSVSRAARGNHQKQSRRRKNHWRSGAGFSYPHGSCTKATVDAVRAAGFACACSAAPAPLVGDRSLRAPPHHRSRLRRRHPSARDHRHSGRSSMSGRRMISIIHYLLNAERFLAQDRRACWPRSSTREYILVDDGSSDGSSAIALDYAARYPGGVRYLDHPITGILGQVPPETRQCGWHPALTSPTSMPTMSGYRTSFVGRSIFCPPIPEVGLICGASRYWYSWSGKPDREDHVVQVGATQDRVLPPPEPLLTLYPLGSGAAPVPSGLLVRRSLVEAVGGWEESYRGPFSSTRIRRFSQRSI